MTEPDDGMNLTVFNAEGLVLSDRQMEALRHFYHFQKLSQI
jgi:hypothetical protein